MIAAVRERPTAALGAAVLAFVALIALLAPLSGYDLVTDVHPDRGHVGPSAAHWLGTDHLGRDVLARLAFAARAFVGPGLLACAVAAFVGIPAGAVAGYHGGSVASALRFGFTVLSAVPRFVLVLLVASIHGDSLPILAAAAGVAYAPALGEAVYGRIETLRQAEYVAANLAHGVPPWRILWVHLVLAACGRLVVRQLLGVFAFFLVLETTLAYIGGFGVQEPLPSWGNMLAFEWGRSETSLVTFLAPGIAIWLVVASTRWVSEALGDRADD